MKKARPFIILTVLLAMLSLSSVARAATPPDSSRLSMDVTTTPPPTPTSTPPPGGSIINSISQIFHHLVFPTETISKALTNIFNKAANKEVRAMSEEVARWTQVIGEIVQAPSQGDYSRAAQSSLPVAAALAPALFLLRLAVYHWGRLLGDDDSGLRVIGDWVTAGVLAVVSGPFLDLVVRLGWWMVGKVIGEAGGLAMNFVSSTTATSVVLGISNLSFIGGLVSVGLSIGSLLAIGGMLFAFASANAVLFILAVLAPDRDRKCSSAGGLAAFPMDQGGCTDLPAAHCGGRGLQSRHRSRVPVRQAGLVIRHHPRDLALGRNRIIALAGRHPRQDDHLHHRRRLRADAKDRATDRLDRRIGRQWSRGSRGRSCKFSRSRFCDRQWTGSHESFECSPAAHPTGGDVGCDGTARTRRV
ncbi:MAG: hypothetical protein IPJ46_09525 [Anaerolineales bacterium]|nr:hypothetical protein [Anaerolineales bacterium]